MPTYNNGFIAKLDSSGTLLWSAVFTNTNPQKIKVDKNGDMVVVGSYFSSGGQWYVNAGTDTPIHTMSSSNYFILRLDSMGMLKWRAPIELPSSNFVDCSDFDLDGKGNVYMTGGYENTSTFYSPDLSVQVIISGSFAYYGSKFFLVKYDSLGVPQWASWDHYSSTGSLGYSIVSDSVGTTYVTGMHRNSGLTAPISITSADASVSNQNIGGYFTFKYNSAGILQWGVGNQYSYYGYGEGITLTQNEVSVVGIIRDASTPFCSTVMTSTSGPVVNLNMPMGDIFVANYDTNGVIKNVFLSGMNTGTYAAEFQKSIFKDTEGMYYVAGVTFANPLLYCGDSITPNGNHDVFVAKFGPLGCGGQLYTGVKDSDPDGNIFSAYPNPVSDELNISVQQSSNYNLNIYNSLGVKIYSQSNITKNNIVIDKNKFSNASGVYFVEVVTGKNRIIEKIIVMY